MSRHFEARKKSGLVSHSNSKEFLKHSKQEMDDSYDDEQEQEEEDDEEEAEGLERVPRNKLKKINISKIRLAGSSEAMRSIDELKIPREDDSKLNLSGANYESAFKSQVIKVRNGKSNEGAANRQQPQSKKLPVHIKQIKSIALRNAARVMS